MVSVYNNSFNFEGVDLLATESQSGNSHDFCYFKAKSVRRLKIVDKNSDKMMIREHTSINMGKCKKFQRL